jgi:hypothetical protein
MIVVAVGLLFAEIEELTILNNPDSVAFSLRINPGNQPLHIEQELLSQSI